MEKGQHVYVHDVKSFSAKHAAGSTQRQRFFFVLDTSLLRDGIRPRSAVMLGVMNPYGGEGPNCQNRCECTWITVDTGVSNRCQNTCNRPEGHDSDGHALLTDHWCFPCGSLRIQEDENLQLDQHAVELQQENTALCDSLITTHLRWAEECVRREKANDDERKAELALQFVKGTKPLPTSTNPQAHSGHELNKTVIELAQMESIDNSVARQHDRWMNCEELMLQFNQSVAEDQALLNANPPALRRTRDRVQRLLNTAKRRYKELKARREDIDRAEEHRRLNTFMTGMLGISYRYLVPGSEPPKCSNCRRHLTQGEAACAGLTPLCSACSAGDGPFGQNILDGGSSKDCPFGTLGLDELTGQEAKALSQDEIKSLYRTAARGCHPDKSDDPLANEVFVRLIAARDLLLDETQRDKLIRMWIDHLWQSNSASASSIFTGVTNRAPVGVSLLHQEMRRAHSHRSRYGQTRDVRSTALQVKTSLAAISKLPIHTSKKMNLRSMPAADREVARAAARDELARNSVAAKASRSKVDKRFESQIHRGWLRAARERYGSKRKAFGGSTAECGPNGPRDAWRRFRRQQEEWKAPVAKPMRAHRQTKVSRRTHRTSQKKKKEAAVAARPRIMDAEPAQAEPKAIPTKASMKKESLYPAGQSSSSAGSCSNVPPWRRDKPKLSGKDCELPPWRRGS